MDSYYIIDNGFILNGFTKYDAATPSTYFDVTPKRSGARQRFRLGSRLRHNNHDITSATLGGSAISSSTISRHPLLLFGGFYFG
jgi:hypothetical protein